MSPRTIGHGLVREAPALRTDETLGSAVPKIIAAELPALPVCDPDGRCVGIFGEREFITAALPAYVGELGYAAFVPRSVDEVLEKRPGARDEAVARHMNTEHIDVPPDFSDAQLAETFLHHRVLIVPVVDRDRQLLGVVTRWDFFRALAERLAQKS